MSNVLRLGRVYIQDVFAGEIRETDEGYEFKQNLIELMESRIELMR